MCLWTNTKRYADQTSETSLSMHQLYNCFTQFLPILGRKVKGKAKLAKKTLIWLFLHWIRVLNKVDTHVIIKVRRRNLEL